MKTQQSFARNEGDKEIVERIQQWFDRFESALQVLLDEKSIHLEYDYKNDNFDTYNSLTPNWYYKVLR